MSKKHDHDDNHQPHTLPDATSLRVKALETVLARKGYINTEALDAVIDAYENQIGPRNGAQVVARSWVDPVFKSRLLSDASGAIAELGFAGFEGSHIRVVENTDATHNMVVCTLCSCYPWSLLGLPPSWYKSFAYRSRAVSEPRKVLTEFGIELPTSRTVRVWDSTAELRYLVLPQRPAGSDDLSEAQLADLVTRNGMIGTAEL